MERQRIQGGVNCWIQGDRAWSLVCTDAKEMAQYLGEELSGPLVVRGRVLQMVILGKVWCHS